MKGENTMNEMLQKLVTILIELRSESSKASAVNSEESIRALMNKYNMLFLGKDFNCIYTYELCHAMNNYFKLNINNDELNSLIPTACKMLNMNFEPMVSLEDISDRKLACYHVTL
jgi:hypothetical protein